jgi:hypothetical protein
MKEYGDTVVDLEVVRHGLRTFKVSGGHCRSVVVGQDHWKNGICVAVCDKPRLAPYLYEQGKLLPKHTSPDEGCTCGVYASLTLEHLYEQYPPYVENMVAVIAAEGQTIIGSKGFRTEVARVVAYWSPVSGFQKIAARDFPDAQGYPQLTDMLNAYGWDSSLADNSMVAKQREQSKLVGVLWIPVSALLLGMDLINFHNNVATLILTSMQTATVVGFSLLWRRLRKKVKAFGTVT